MKLKPTLCKWAACALATSSTLLTAATVFAADSGTAIATPVNTWGKVIQDDAHLCAYCGKRVSGVIARKRLVRPRSGRKIAGVCAGFAEYFDLDVALVRIVWLVCSLFGLLGVVAYAAAWIVVPEEPLALAAPQAEPTKVANL